MSNVGVIMGGGIESDGSLPEHVAMRVQAALENLQTLQHIVFSSRYTLNKPQVLDAQGFVITEAAAMAQSFDKQKKQKNIPLYLELASTDTIGSALHTRALLENIGVIQGKLKIFTNDWHAARTELIFSWAFGLTAKHLRVQFDIECLAIQDKNPSLERIQKESISLSKFKSEWGSIATLSDAWRHLYRTHDNYNLKNNSSILIDKNFKY